MSDHPALLRSIRRRDLVAVTINAVIGAGIFGLPAKAFALVGPYSLLTFAVCAAAASFIILCFAEVASRFSATGGPFLYSTEAYGAVVGFEVGWLTWLARLTAFAANANLMVQYLGFYFPDIAHGAGRVTLLCVVVVPLIVINVLSIRDVTATGNVLVIAKLVPLLLFVAIGVFFLEPARFQFPAPPTFSTFSLSVLLALYAFTGFEMAVIPGGEMKNPRRDLPIALLLGMAVIVTVYLLVNVVAIGTCANLGASERPLADAAAGFLGKWGVLLITVGILISLAGNLNTLLLAASRLIFAMAEHGALPAPLAAIHPRFRTPIWSVLITGGVMLVVTIAGTFVSQLTISAITRLAAYLMTCSALIVFRRRASAPPAQFLVAGGPVLAVLAISAALWLLSNASPKEARDTALAAAAGMAIYLAHRAWKRYSTRNL